MISYDINRIEDLFSIISTIESGKGQVYVVEFLDPKTIPPALFVLKTLRDEYKNNEEYKTRFIKEIAFLLNVTLSEHIPQLQRPLIPIPHVCGVGFIKAYPTILIDFIDGLNLRELIDKKIVISPKQSIYIALQICKALLVSHRHGLIAHRDIKPENIMVDNYNKVFLIDFGIAKLKYTKFECKSNLLGNKNSRITEKFMKYRQSITGFSTLPGQNIGTPQYMAPEHFVDMHELDERADVYALGIVLYEMLCGKRPFYGETFADFRNQHELHNPPPLETFNPALSKNLIRVVDKCLKKHPAERFQSIKELHQSLRLNM